MISVQSQDPAFVLWKIMLKNRHQIWVLQIILTYFVSLYNWPPVCPVWIQPNKYICCSFNIIKATETVVELLNKGYMSDLHVDC